MDEWRRTQKSFRSGRQGEAFCQEVFGISEPRYEIKSCGYHRVVVQCCQLLESLAKQYVIVRYFRKERRLKSGPRKGRRIYEGTIEKAYENKVHVVVVRGHRILRAVHGLKLTVGLSGKDKILEVGRFVAHWIVPLREIGYDEGFLVEETDKYALYAFPDDPPGWMIEDVARQTDLFRERPSEDEEAPF